MPVKIRLSRHGKKRSPYYHILVADSRAPRDGKYIDKIGMYNPTTIPATIDLDFDKALDWLQKGALPTDTCRAILSYKGVLMKNHLLNGAKKGAFSEEEAEKKFEAWLKEKESKVIAKANSKEKAEEDEIKQRLNAEIKVNEARAAKIAAKRKAELDAGTEAAAEASVEAEAEVAPEAEVAAEVAPKAVVEEAIEEKAEETVVEEVKEEPAAEVKEEEAEESDK